jgi:hypothetical protein
MKPPVQSPKTKRRFGPLRQKIVGVIAIACAIIVPRATQAAKTQGVPSFSKRASNVKEAIDQMAPGMKLTDAPPTVMQWGNWPNWQNWGNWGNWNNWNNWPNWVNW